MQTLGLSPLSTPAKVKPLCPYFGTCGGCAYQDLAYEDELRVKEENLKNLFMKKLSLPAGVFKPIVPSPRPYAYRSRLDLSLARLQGEIRLGFNAEGRKRLIDIESCAIAYPSISAFIPTLKKLAAEKLPEDYRRATLVVKTGDGGEIRWGGIGRRSLKLQESEYHWTEIEGKKIFYSLDTFFQANLSILPSLMKTLRLLLELTSETCLLDLYAGVGLFWVIFAGEAGAVYAVEENGAAVGLAEFNRRHHGFSHVFLREGRTEDCLEDILKEIEGLPSAAICDPPRQGFTPEAFQKLTRARSLDPLICISCNPEALERDLAGFLEEGWSVDRVIPFDFFPKTKHLEVVVRLRPR